MILLKWWREYREIKTEYKICESCETLKMQLAIANDEKKALLDRLLNPTKPTELVPNQTEFKPIQPRSHLSWRVKQQILQAEDREAAKQLARNKEEINQEVKKADVAELEKEFGIDASTTASKEAS